MQLQEQCCLVRIVRCGADAFGWEIHRGSDVVDRSARPFATRIDAILDSARAAENLETTASKPSSIAEVAA